ncbi:MAG: M48 family metallopeptidase [Ardenticatenales bacterium]|nr:M48 family metallopeptidase [Ardenticatenales bacterium]
MAWTMWRARRRCERRWRRGCAVRRSTMRADWPPTTAPGSGRLPSDVRLTNAQRRWGSCSAAGVVRVHWRLVQAPPPAFAYVVAHEIAHLAVRDHSPRFWATVERIMPGHAVDRAALKAWERANAGGHSMP